MFITIAQKNANGWTSLFDGKTLNGWQKLAGTAQYKIENGMITGTTVLSSPNTFLVTEKEYSDFKFFLFNTYFPNTAFVNDLY